MGTLKMLLAEVRDQRVLVEVVGFAPRTSGVRSNRRPQSRFTTLPMPPKIVRLVVNVMLAKQRCAGMTNAKFAELLLVLRSKVGLKLLQEYSTPFGSKILPSG